MLACLEFVLRHAKGACGGERRLKTEVQKGGRKGGREGGREGKRRVTFLYRYKEGREGGREEGGGVDNSNTHALILPSRTPTNHTNKQTNRLRAEGKEKGKKPSPPSLPPSLPSSLPPRRNAAMESMEEDAIAALFMMGVRKGGRGREGGREGKEGGRVRIKSTLIGALLIVSPTHPPHIHMKTGCRRSLLLPLLLLLLLHLVLPPSLPPCLLGPAAL